MRLPRLHSTKRGGAGARGLRPALGHCARILGPARAIATKLLDPVTQIGVVTAEAAFGEHDRDFGGKRGSAEPSAGEHHAREPRRQRKRAQPLADLGDPSVEVDRAELAQQGLGLGKRRVGRRIKKDEPARIGQAPMGEVEHEAG